MRKVVFSLLLVFGPSLVFPIVWHNRQIYASQYNSKFFSTWKWHYSFLCT